MKIRIVDSILLEATPEEKYKQYKQYIDDYEVYIQIVSADPTSLNNGKLVKFGNYSNWLLKLYMNDRLKIEDLYKATEYLTVFNKFKKRLDINERDISKYKTISELYKTLEANGLFNKITKRDIRRDIHSGKDDVKIVYEDDNLLVVIPLTREASCYWGTNTQWCTATREMWNNQFEYYNKKGNLYIVINKNTDEKYQFHFETESFMDAEDDSINIIDLLYSKKSVYRPLANIFEKFLILNEDDRFTISGDKVVITIEEYDTDSYANIISFYREYFSEYVDFNNYEFSSWLDDDDTYYYDEIFYIIIKNWNRLFSDDFKKSLDINSSEDVERIIEEYGYIFNRSGIFSSLTYNIYDFMMTDLLETQGWSFVDDRAVLELTRDDFMTTLYLLTGEVSNLDDIYIYSAVNIDKIYHNAVYDALKECRKKPEDYLSDYIQEIENEILDEL